MVSGTGGLRGSPTLLVALQHRSGQHGQRRLNHDLWTIRGQYGYKPQLPAVGGTEVAGVIDAIGEGVERVKVGQRYAQFLHYAEGSAMLPLMLKVYTARLGDGVAALQPRIQSELQNHLGFLNQELTGREYFVGDELTGADIQLSFVAQLCLKFCGRDAFPNITAFVDRIEARPAYQRTMEKGGA